MNILVVNLCSLLLVGVFFCLNVSAATLDDQRKVFVSENENVDYVLTLSALKTINAVSTAEREVRLRGDLVRTTYEFNPGLSVNDAWALVEERFNFSELHEFFTCAGLDCGSSNAWANYRFGIKQLYGLDQSQRYHVFSKAADSNEFVALYFVQRGNRRIYLQVDKISVDHQIPKIPVSPSVILNKLETRTWFALYVDNSGGFVTDEVALLAKALRKKPLLKVYVVGHSYNAGNFEGNASQAEAYAQELKNSLLALGISASRVSVKSAGPLSPREAPGRDRVEIVISN